VRFALSTLTAAAFGQIFSDVAGVLSGSTVEAFAARLGLPKANLTQAQYLIPRVKMVSTMGQCVGVIIGCLLGMCSLFFMDLERADRLKKQAELATLFETLLDEGSKLIEAERCTLFLVDETADGTPFLWSKTKTGVEPSNEDLMRTFKQYDRGGKGSIAPEDLEFALNKLGVVFRLDQIEEMINEVDGKCSGEQVLGRLNFEEFKTAMRQFILNKEVRIELHERGTKNWVVQNKKVSGLQVRQLIQMYTNTDLYLVAFCTYPSHKMLNIQDVHADTRCSPAKYKFKYKTAPRNILIGPVMDQKGEKVSRLCTPVALLRPVPLVDTLPPDMSLVHTPFI
jgi:hypothetical protein